MPSNQTANYALSQWSKDDRVLMDDFNADNAKIDAALGTMEQTVAEHSALLPKLGNCSVYIGSYIGTGEYEPVSQTFPARPVFIVVMDGATALTIMGVRDMTTTYFTKGDNDHFTLTWGERSVSWRGGSVIGRSMNAQDRPYFYMALLAMDE